jgi:hypothetical protein
MGSEYRESAIRRRDERQTKVPIIRRPSGSKKDTRKWCRGRIGVEHKPQCVSHDEWENRQDGSDWSKDWRVLVCEECGKQLDYWFPVPWWRDEKSPPNWVTA